MKSSAGDLRSSERGDKKCEIPFVQLPHAPPEPLPTLQLLLCSCKFKRKHHFSSAKNWSLELERAVMEGVSRFRPRTFRHDKK